MTLQTHSNECWRWHHECAVARIERDEALLRQALEALVYAPVGFPQCPHTITALRERLAEKE